MLAVSSLYDWAGGEAAFVRLINAFYDRVEVDALLSPLFPGGVTKQHRVHVIAWWCEVFGGPTRYSDELGGYERMLAKHHNLAITPEQRFRFASLMSLAADDAELPKDPEFRSAFVAYIEWGTRLARHNSQPGPRSSSTRRSRAGWGEAPPFHPWQHRLHALSAGTESTSALSVGCA
jgi:hemoglobin